VVRTYGLTHISLAVRDLSRARQFYEELLGAKPILEERDSVQLQTPGAHDVIVLEEQTRTIEGGTAVKHFGFRLIDAADIDQAVDEAQRAGGTLLRRGEFRAGFPFAYVRDPDGNEIELWYE